jgi:uncharacterized membrane protein YuzA (DUF378 family)
MTQNSPKRILNDRAYNILRQSALIILPAIGALYFGLAQIWHFAYQEEVSGSIAVLNTFVGVLVGFAKIIHDVSGAQYDGSVALEEGEEGSMIRLKQIDPNAFFEKDALVLKIHRPTSTITTEAVSSPSS